MLAQRNRENQYPAQIRVLFFIILSFVALEVPLLLPDLRLFARQVGQTHLCHALDDVGILHALNRVFAKSCHSCMLLMMRLDEWYNFILQSLLSPSYSLSGPPSGILCRRCAERRTKGQYNRKVFRTISVGCTPLFSRGSAVAIGTKCNRSRSLRYLYSCV